MTEPMPQTKPCSRCGEVFPVTAEYFKPERRFKVGFAAECRSCRAIRERRRYGSDPDHHRARMNAWRKANPERLRAMQERGRIKTHGTASA
jgi:hypothetical protein